MSSKYQSKYSGRIIQQKKQCPGCPHLREAIVVSSIDSVPSMQVPLSCFFEPTPLKKFSAEISAEKDTSKEDRVFGICTWSRYWKVLYKVEKPRKCSKVPS